MQYQISVQARIESPTIVAIHGTISSIQYQGLKWSIKLTKLQANSCPSGLWKFYWWQSGAADEGTLKTVHHGPVHLPWFIHTMWTLVVQHLPSIAIHSLNWNLWSYFRKYFRVNYIGGTSKDDKIPFLNLLWQSSCFMVSTVSKLQTNFPTSQLIDHKARKH